MNKIINISSNQKEKPGQEQIKFYDAKKLAEIMECSVVTARSIMNSGELPVKKIGRTHKVSSVAFEKWSAERHV